MAEMVASAVVGETLSRISTFLIDKPDQKPSDMERLEMAHIKMEAALQISTKWQITDVPLLRWRSKLKRAAQESNETLRHCKQRAMEDEVARQGISQSSFPKRIAHAAKSFMSSFIAHGTDESSSYVDVRRFERFAEGAGEFLKFVEFGATGRQHMFFNPLIHQLLAGKALRYQALRGSRFYYLVIRPMSFAERGVEAMVGFVLQDLRAPAKSFSLGFMLRLSESSDIFGIIIGCMQSVTPHFKVADVIKRELIQLPTQDFSWQTHSPYGENSSLFHVHNALTKWFRPNPLCCSEHEHDDRITHASSNSKNPNVPSPAGSRLAFAFQEQVIVIYLQCHISVQNKHLQNSTVEHGIKRRRSNTRNSDSALLKLGVLVIPHDSPEGIEPTAESFAFEVIDGKEQEMVHRNASLHDIDEKLLPKAIDYLFQNSESTMYQMCLRSRHGTAHLCVEKTTTRVQSVVMGKSARSKSLIRNSGGDPKQEKYGVQGWPKVARNLHKLWVVRASDKLHDSIRSWLITPLGATNG